MAEQGAAASSGSLLASSGSSVSGCEGMVQNNSVNYAGAGAGSLLLWPSVRRAGQVLHCTTTAVCTALYCTALHCRCCRIRFTPAALCWHLNTSNSAMKYSLELKIKGTLPTLAVLGM
jgi:hypothetical protein